MIEKKSTKEDGVLATWKITGGKKPSMREFFHLSTCGYHHKNNLFNDTPKVQKTETTVNFD
ncbi:MAG: hypothetical protein ACOWW1_11030 [archaeon]